MSSLPEFESIQCQLNTRPGSSVVKPYIRLDGMAQRLQVRDDVENATLLSVKSYEPRRAASCDRRKLSGRAHVPFQTKPQSYACETVRIKTHKWMTHMSSVFDVSECFNLLCWDDDEMVAVTRDTTTSRLCVSLRLIDAPPLRTPLRWSSILPETSLVVETVAYEQDQTPAP